MDDQGPNADRRRSLTAAGVVAAAGAAHARVAAVGLGAEGILLAVDHLYQLVLVAGLLWLCIAVGRRLLQWTGPDDLRPVDLFLSSVLMGMGGLGILLLVAGLAGLLHGPGVAVLLLAAGWWSRHEITTVPDLLARSARRVPRPVLAVAGLMGLALLARALAPPLDWDSLMYHLDVPAKFLEEGRIFLPADSLHVAFVGFVHMLYVPLLAFGSSSAPAVFSVALAMLLPVAVYRLARVSVGRVAAEMSGVAIWGSGMIALVAATPRLDVTLGLYLVVAHYALYEAVAGRRGRPWLALSAVLAGLSIGVKYQAGAYVAGLGCVLIWATLSRDGDGYGVGARDLLLFAGLVALVSVPMFVKNWMLLEAPFYPFLSERLLPPWLAELYGSRVAPDFVGREIYGALADIRRPFDPIDAFLHPERLGSSGEATHYHLSSLLLLLPAWLLAPRDRKLAWMAGPALIFLAVLLAVSLRANLRYFIVALPGLTATASALAVRAATWASARVRGPAVEAGKAGKPDAAWWDEHHRVRAVALGLAAVSLVPTGYALVDWLPRETSLGHLVGRQARMDYLGERRNPALVIHAGLTDFGERPLPDESEVLMLFEARGYYSTVPVLKESVLTNWPLLAPIRNRLDCLRATDITHVLVGTGVLQYYLNRGLDPETVRWQEFRTFAGRCLEKVLEVPGYVFYRVPPAER